jgi:hypothetical protein
VDHRILVGTHHKSGSVWMLTIFKRICKKLSWNFFVKKSEAVPPEFDVLVDSHSAFGTLPAEQNCRGLHVIRDPRDIIISGCFYHQKSHERWLHVPRPEFGGLTYQEKINSYPSQDDRILFEMENGGWHCIQEMMAWNYDNPVFFEAKYEDLIADEDLLLFHQIFSFLGFSGRIIPQALEIAYECSLFSGQVSHSAHVRSGKARQWEKHFTPAHRERFLELYGDVLLRLEYESNHAWTEPTLRVVAPPAHTSLRRAA